MSAVGRLSSLRAISSVTIDQRRARVLLSFCVYKFRHVGPLHGHEAAAGGAERGGVHRNDGGENGGKNFYHL